VQGSLAAKLPVLLMNRYDPDLPGFGVDRLKQMLRAEEVETVASDYSSVSSSINQGLPLRLKEPRSRVLADINRLALKLAPLDGTPSSKNGSSVFGGLIRALGIKR
jgi:Flp pilus assembly CpaE family ATPase